MICPVNISNTYGKVSTRHAQDLISSDSNIPLEPVNQSQAIALSVQAGNFGAYAVALKGYQDTLLANKVSWHITRLIRQHTKPFSQGDSIL
jgi:hypothetical protein